MIPVLFEGIQFGTVKHVGTLCAIAARKPATSVVNRSVEHAPVNVKIVVPGSASHVTGCAHLVVHCCALTACIGVTTAVSPCVDPARAVVSTVGVPYASNAMSDAGRVTRPSALPAPGPARAA